MASRLLEYLGGTKELEKRAPQVQKLLKGVVSNPPVKDYYIQYYDASDNSERKNIYADDTFQIYLGVEAVFSGPDGIHALLRTNFHERQKILSIITDIYDSDSNRLLDTRSEYFENTVYQEHKILFSSTLAKQCAKKKIRVESSFTWTTDGKEAHEQTVIFEIDEFTDNGKDVIAKIQVEAPRAKDGKLTKVLYDREHMLSEKIDYHYTNVMQKDGTAKLMMPFKGKVTVVDGFVIKDIHKAVEKSKLCMLLENKDGVEYSNEKSFAEQFAFEDGRRTISWEINDDWNTELDLSHFNVSTILDLSCEFTLEVVDPNSPGFVHLPKIMINSVADPQPYVVGSGSFEIERIMIQWGCVAETTMLLMAAGTQKKICEIKIGDKVRAGTESSSVVNIYKGKEDELAHLETQNGCILCMTNSHPVKTTRGFVKASELTAADTIVTVAGESKVKYLYMEQYGREVYNIELEPKGEIVCNGIIAGDFSMQNEMGEKLCTAEPPTSLQMEFRSLFNNDSNI